jgi:hypothetical protein
MASHSRPLAHSRFGNFDHQLAAAEALSVQSHTRICKIIAVVLPWSDRGLLWLWFEIRTWPVRISPNAVTLSHKSDILPAIMETNLLCCHWRVVFPAFSISDLPILSIMWIHGLTRQTPHASSRSPVLTAVWSSSPKCVHVSYESHKAHDIYM